MNRYTNQSDQQLAKLTLAGDEAGFAELVRRYQGLVTSILNNMLGNTALADELTQITFMMAWERRHSFRFGSYKSWVCRIASNQAISALRRSKVETDYIDNRQRELLGINEMDRHVDQHIVDIQMSRAMAQLSESQRHVVSLVYTAGMTYAEVSDTLNMPIGTAKSHGQRGMAALVKLINGGHDE